MEQKWVYILGFGCIVLAVVGTLFIMMSTSQTTPVLDEKPNVTISVPNPAVVGQDSGGTFIAYTMETSRFGDDNLNLVKVEVLDKSSGAVLLKLDGTALTRVYEPGLPTQSTGTNVPSPLPRIRIQAPVPSGQVPGEITNRLTFVSKEKASLPFSITGGDLVLPSRLG
ncbi:MAG: hypothetical protein LUQ50_12620 [Methanospirillum sp.]|uniref:hypothetical protein n=1 Tax=Methanospirillum sp. TaxID=45200 RepID=UPI00236E246C|nr:hypothetical protein [Methanospirillum sp.]MDD1729900.1 hypothetical protein [Methanospirillum sp.]